MSLNKTCESGSTAQCGYVQKYVSSHGLKSIRSENVAKTKYISQITKSASQWKHVFGLSPQTVLLGKYPIRYRTYPNDFKNAMKTAESGYERPKRETNVSSKEIHIHYKYLQL